MSYGAIALHLRSVDIPRESDDLEWLALIQHHGGPTRLLDFTRSIFVAAYFAAGTLNRNERAAIWAVNWQYMYHNMRVIRRDYAEEIEAAQNARQAFGNQFGPNDWISAAIHREIRILATILIEPFRQNKRLMQQQGLFIAPLDISQPFTANLSAMFWPKPDLLQQKEPKPLSDLEHPDHCAVIKFVIPKGRYVQFQADLRQMNIVTENLFPDLEGEVRSLADILTEHCFVDGTF